MTATPLEATTLDTLWLDLTRKCQLACSHCYNDSGPTGSHGTMTRNDWFRVIYDAAVLRVRRIQLIGGEPTTHPDFADLVDHALNQWLNVEVFSNLVHVSPAHWELFQRSGISLATSYYSDDANEHNAVTGRRSHGRTRANIAKAIKLGIPIRVGIIATSDEQRVDEAWRDLESLGVTRIHVDHVRPFGRGGNGQEPDVSRLCGQCGKGAASISPTGDVSPCVFSTWMSVGSVQADPLAAILRGTAMNEANVAIRAEAASAPCSPQAGSDCDPNVQCSPGVGGSECDPRF
ncbi:MoaA/NifB/PqqE/SkfB family radical SAM enzyme [Haloactinospora alba]|uniref:MoaA/NifB/PqqE/SkfB family radical SAM enzyme n=1 Tax=Haloactinospora alba TaxID=405555 RepID=A0A543NHC0_9ACTN|nr:radical SAM protein [Haloactinospora alba]TQN31150.1 MoaA/NifB/PqqE/SkfB family radical SAM enzyme [Haloactinospora alba]